MVRRVAKDLLLGVHCSAAGGAYHALYAGASIGCTTIQLFTANQRTWSTKALTEEAIARWEVALEETQLRDIMSHDSYLINLGCPREEILHKSRIAFRQEIERCTALKIRYLNFHPGAALDDPVEKCLDRISTSLKSMAKLLEKGSTVLLLESTAGQGSVVGHRFEQLAVIIEKAHAHVPIGVCLDTCHLFAAGYDIRDRASWDATLKEFDAVIGLKYLRALHLNDSVHELGSRKDRHESLGKGKIGLECFRVAMTHPLLRHLPKYLETPNGEVMYAKEIALLRKMAQSK
jgi:deoxyribonuclease IV